ARYRAPRPGSPLHLNASQPVRVEGVAQRVQSGLSVADTRERRHARLFARGDHVGLACEPLARAGELRILGPRAGIREAGPRLGDRRTEVGDDDDIALVQRARYKLSQ